MKHLRNGRRDGGAPHDEAGAPPNVDIAPPGRAPTQTGPTQRTPGQHLARRLVIAAVLALGVFWVWLPIVPFSVVGSANLAVSYATVGVSLVVLTGWVGQISLGHAAFVGIGAFGTAWFSRTFFDLPFPFSLPVGAGLAALAAVVLGMATLRVRGLYLAVSTLIFAWMADAYLFNSAWFGSAGGSAQYDAQQHGVEGGFPFFDWTDRRTFYLVGLAGLGFALVAAANIRDSKTGRAFFAVRGSEVAAASLGINVTRYKLLAFGFSGFLAGMAGNLMIAHSQTVSPISFTFTVSLFYLAIPVVGGLHSLPGAVVSAAIFASLNEIFFRVAALEGWLEVVSAGLLTGVLLFYPGGLAVFGQRMSNSARARMGLTDPEVDGRDDDSLPEPVPEVTTIEERLRRLEERERRLLELEQRLLGDVSDDDSGDDSDDEWEAEDWSWSSEEAAWSGDRIGAPAASVSVFDSDEPCDEYVEMGPLGDVPSASPVVLAAEDVTVRFGGLTAVDTASLQVHQGEIVGLIGPNGAGKSTLFNAVAGFVAPTTGRIMHNGEDITALQVHERAARGIGRTFQTVQLFPQISVYDNVLAATHLSNPSGFLGHMVVSSTALCAEHDARTAVDGVIARLGLRELAHRKVAGLPLGVLRLVELARALASNAPLVMLDEPASGLDSAETERFASLLRELRDETGLSILIIEHDVATVMALCDRIHVLTQGKMIAAGSPEDVRNDPQVIAAYLGSANTEGADDEQGAEQELDTDDASGPEPLVGPTDPTVEMALPDFEDDEDDEDRAPQGDEHDVWL